MPSLIRFASTSQEKQRKTNSGILQIQYDSGIQIGGNLNLLSQVMDLLPDFRGEKGDDSE